MRLAHIAPIAAGAVPATQARLNGSPLRRIRRQVLTLFVLVSGTVVIAQRPTLREMVIEAQADVNVLVSANRPAPVPFARLLEITDHVVRATIGKSVSHLSEDGFDISTQFELTNQRVLFSANCYVSTVCWKDGDVHAHPARRHRFD